MIHVTQGQSAHDIVLRKEIIEDQELLCEILVVHGLHHLFFVVLMLSRVVSYRFHSVVLDLKMLILTKATSLSLNPFTTKNIKAKKKHEGKYSTKKWRVILRWGGVISDSFCECCTSAVYLAHF